MSERSRRPKSSPTACDSAVVDLVLNTFDTWGCWGARKIRELAWPDGNAPVCERTVGRILKRHGRSVVGPSAQNAELRRFERETANELWQVDFKKLGSRRHRVETLNVVDDATRFCIASEVVPDQALEAAWHVLWDAFLDYGLPVTVLSDNGSAFRNNATWRWSSFDLRLMLLDIKPAHGKPYHPETQGKVERFHRTMQHELNSKFKCSQDLSNFRNRYNWVRPHEAIGLKAPGMLYKPSARKRPLQMPQPFFPDGAMLRKADDTGAISFKGKTYKLGRSFAKQPVGILEDENHVLQVVWGNFTLAPLQDFYV
jgi:transposase InsO family protein